MRGATRTRAKRGTVVPEVCQYDDKAAYMRLYRERRRGYVEANNARMGARRAAALTVAKAHPDEYEAALAVELQRRGLT